MKMILIILSICLIVFLVLILPLPCKTKFVLDVKSRSFYFTLSVLGLSLAKGKIYLLDDYSFSIISTTSKIMQSDDPKKMQQMLIQNLLSNVKINEIIFLMDGGLIDDPFLTSMAIGSFKSILSAFLPQLKTTKIDIRLNPVYNENNLNIASKINISLTMLNIIISIIYAKTKYSKLIKKGVVNEKE